MSGADRTLCWIGPKHRFGSGFDSGSDDIPELIEIALKIATTGPDNVW